MLRTTIALMLLASIIRRPLIVVAGPAILSGFVLRASSAVRQSQVSGNEFFHNEVQPILRASCAPCHTGDKPAGGLTLSSRELLLKGGTSGPAISQKQPEQSLLLKAINYRGPQMPPSGRLPQRQVDALTRWVKMGAPWPAGAAEPPKTMAPPVNAETMKWWAFQPVRRPVVPPAVGGKQFVVRNPIDSFVLARLRKAGLTPNPQASKTVLIRRAYYNLLGLPPSPEQVRAFLADTSPKSWERLVDRLLASPQYGERWGRHWLDLVHYAETNSYERDGHKPNAWRYRDYVIRSFNQDKPYDRFIREQLAGDELPGRSSDCLIATGYYRLGIWDDEPSDPQQALYDDMDDIARTTGEVFLGLTVGCARCHDHKIDPIPQKDYYRFLAFFAGVNRYGAHNQLPIASEDDQRKFRTEVEAYQAKVRAVQDPIDALERRIMPDLSPVEKEEWNNPAERPQIVQKRVPRLLAQVEFDQYTGRLKERQRLDRNVPKPLESALAVTEDPEPRVTHVLLRGNPHVEGDVVEPGFLSVLNAPAPEIRKPAHGATCGRRTALANWLASPSNPLTARVMVNRIWQYQFGRGLVRTPSNFGFQGSAPTHPELLDWLASEFVSNGWSVKKLQKLIMTSSTYQMSSSGQELALKKDPENDHFWRFDMRRLEAEEVRDSLLAVNGSLNLKMGGPSIYTKMPKEVLAGQSMPGAGWGDSPPEERCRRSVYIYVKRSLPVPVLASFDGPETDFTCPVRFATTQPTQALSTLNSAFINEQSTVFAAYLRKNAGGEPVAQVRLALWRVMQREPTAKEVARGVRLMADLQARFKVPIGEALVRFCTVALNLNEFLYLD